MNHESESRSISDQQNQPEMGERETPAAPKVFERQSLDSTLFVRLPLGSTIERYQLDAACSEYGPVKKTALVRPKDNTKRPYAFCRFINAEDAKTAAKSLKHVQGIAVKVELATAASQRKEKPAKDSLEHQKKTARVIIRNLSFYANEGQIRQALASFGNLVDVHIPSVGKQKRGFAFCTFENRKQASACVKAGSIAIAERESRVDWSLPRQQYENRKQAGKGGRKTEEMDSQDDREGEEDREDSSVQSEEQVQDDEDGEEPENDAPNDVNEKQSIFVRNLPFDASRHDLFLHFKEFGHVEGIYLVKDKTTDLFKGTAFVKFKTQQAAQRAVDKPDQTMKSRSIFIQLAVDRNTAVAFQQKNHMERKAKDKRHLYLAEAGRVQENWDQLPVLDQRKRQESQKEMKSELRSPLFSINPCRLSIRNLAKHVDEKSLKQLVSEATQEGMPLVSVDDQLAHWRATGDYTTKELLEKVNSDEDVIPVYDGKNIKKFIPSVFVVRDVGGMNSPSRGFAFVEFTHHIHALSCQRQLNNNPQYSVQYVAAGRKPRSKTNVSSSDGKDEASRVPRLIVEFAVENKIKAQQQSKHRAAKQVNQIVQKTKSKTEKADATKKRSRGAIQREKKRQRAILTEDDTPAAAVPEVSDLSSTHTSEKVVKPARKKNAAKRKRKTDADERMLTKKIEAYEASQAGVRENTSPSSRGSRKKWYDD